MKSIKYIFLLSFLVFATEAFGQRTVTLTTYYPAPFGVYQRMRVTEDLIVGADVDQEPDATLHVEGSAYIAGGIGDSSLDGNVNIFDIITVQQFLTQTDDFTPEQFAEADITGRGIVGPFEHGTLTPIIQGAFNLNDPLDRIAIRRPLGRMIFPVCEGSGAVCRDADNYGYAIGALTRLEDEQPIRTWRSAIYITSTGDVGIGTVEPDATLHVEGSAYIAGGGGDANLDGLVKPADASLIIAFVLGTSDLTPEQFAEADVTGTGIVSLYDAQSIQHILLGLDLNDPLTQTRIKRPLGRMIFPWCEANTLNECLDADNYGYAIGGGTRDYEESNPTRSTIYITSTGDVGIGTGEPQSTLHVDGQIRLEYKTPEGATHWNGDDHCNPDNDGVIVYGPFEEDHGGVSIEMCICTGRDPADGSPVDPCEFQKLGD